jgi:hypothetical protein
MGKCIPKTKNGQIPEITGAELIGGFHKARQYLQMPGK